MVKVTLQNELVEFDDRSVKGNCRSLSYKASMDNIIYHYILLFINIVHYNIHIYFLFYFCSFQN